MPLSESWLEAWTGKTIIASTRIEAEDNQTLVIQPHKTWLGQANRRSIDRNSLKVPAKCRFSIPRKNPLPDVNEVT